MAKRPTQTQGPVSVDMDDGVLVYSARHGAVISLNASARAIWRLCDGTRTAEEICQKLAGELEVEPADLMPDIELGLKQLEENALITRE